MGPTPTDMTKAPNLNLNCDIDPTLPIGDLLERLGLEEQWETGNKDLILQQPMYWKDGMPRVGLFYDDTMLQHRGEVKEIEKPGRLSVPYRFLNKEGTTQRCFTFANCLASTSDLTSTHSIDYVKSVKTGAIDFSEDVYWNEKTDQSAQMAAGCSVSAVNSVLNSSLDSAFALIRPPGHHAERAMAKGFCFYNNAAIAAFTALKNTQYCKRVVILDWDVHHGNGTQNIFYEDDRVLYISIHRGGLFYPGTGFVNEIGEAKGRGFNVNIPWPGKGFGNLDYLAAFQIIVEPLISAFNPDLTIISAGFDAVVHDPLGGLNVAPECFGLLTHRILKLSPKTVMLLEGGYNLLQLTVCISSCIRVLLGDDPQPIPLNSELMPETEKTLFSVGHCLSGYWPCLSSKYIAERMKKFYESLP